MFRLLVNSTHRSNRFSFRALPAIHDINWRELPGFINCGSYGADFLRGEMFLLKGIQSSSGDAQRIPV